MEMRHRTAAHHRSRSPCAPIAQGQQAGQGPGQSGVGEAASHPGGHSASPLVMGLPLPGRNSCNVTGEISHEGLEGSGPAKMTIATIFSRFAGGHEKCRTGIQSFLHKSPAKQIMALCVGCAFEGGINGEMGLLVLHGGIGLVTILKEHDPGQEGARCVFSQCPSR